MVLYVLRKDAPGFSLFPAILAREILHTLCPIGNGLFQPGITLIRRESLRVKKKAKWKTGKNLMWLFFLVRFMKCGG